MINVTTIDEAEAIGILNQEEGHFLDFMQKDYSGEPLQKKCVAFANADGGEVFVGIIDKDAKNLSGGILERWGGFENQESANNIIADVIENVQPRLANIEFEFYEISGQEDRGKVLKISVEKATDVHSTASGNIYQRHGARSPLLNEKQATDLRLSKGESSYENQRISEYDIDRLIDSVELNKFLKYYLPRTNPEEFLQKQGLIVKNGETTPVYAAVLLYDDMPSAVLSKRCGVKVVRYDTDTEEPEREHFKNDYTIEGPLHQQINETIEVILAEIERVPIMGAEGLEKAKYPREAIKEVVVNALIHRDYNISDDVIVLIFNNRIEVKSPGVLPGNITEENILNERFSRNSKIVRLLNKYQDRPNHDIGEGLNTAFQKMKEVRLKPPIITQKDNGVTVVLPHEHLASPEEQIMAYLETHNEITNLIARKITGIKSENAVKNCFYKLRDKNYIHLDPNKHGANSAWVKLVSQNSVILPENKETKKLESVQQTLFNHD